MADEAIPAATLILVRDRADGPAEILMVERAEGMAFAAGALVFPGGRIDRLTGNWADELKLDPARSPRSAKRSRRPRSPLPSAHSPLQRLRTAAARARRRTSRSARRFPMCGCRIDASSLTPFARWVPKFHAVRRFDTMFFIAAGAARRLAAAA